MTDECVQYLAQLQKDWERHRVKMGVEALRKEVGIHYLDLYPRLSLSPRSRSETASAKKTIFPRQAAQASATAFPLHPQSKTP